MWRELVEALILTSGSAAIGVGMVLPLWRNRLREKVASRIEEDYTTDVERISRSGHLTEDEKRRLIVQLTMMRQRAVTYHEDMSWGRSVTTEGYITPIHVGVVFQSPYIQHRMFDRWKKWPARILLFLSSIIGAAGVGYVIRGNEQMDTLLALTIPVLMTGVWGMQHLKRSTPTRREASEWMAQNMVSTSNVDSSLGRMRKPDTSGIHGTTFSYASDGWSRNLYKVLLFSVLAVSLHVSQGADLPLTQWMTALMLPSLLGAALIAFETKKRKDTHRVVRHFFSKQEVDALIGLEDSVGTFVRRWTASSVGKDEKVMAYWLNREMSELDRVAIGLMGLVDIAERIEKFEKQRGIPFPQVRTDETWEKDGGAEKEYLDILDSLMTEMERLKGNNQSFHQETKRIEQTIFLLEDVLDRQDVDSPARGLTEATLMEARNRLEEESQKRVQLRREMKIMEQESILKTVNHSLNSKGMFEEWVFPENLKQEIVGEKQVIPHEKEES